MKSDVWKRWWQCVHASALGFVRLLDPSDRNPPGPAVHGGSPGKNAGGVAMPPPETFPTQGSNPRLRYGRRDASNSTFT